MKLLAKYFYIDSRSLRLFRMTLSLTILIDLVVRMTDFSAHYTNNGVLPLVALFKHRWNDAWWSFLVLNSEIYFQAAFFAIILIACLLLFAGYRTRLMTIICWIGLVSIQNRNLVISQGGDDLLRMMIFWSIFLPLHKGNSKFKVSTVATMAILMQVLFALQFSAIFKDPFEWWNEGSAIYNALHLDQIARPIGLLLSDNYQLTVFLTRLVFLIELLILPLFLFPFFREKVRYIVIFLLLAFSIGIISSMMIGIFPICFLASIPLFIPTLFWRFLERKKSFFFLQKYFVTNTNVVNANNGFRIPWILQSVLGFFFILIILWNIATLPRSPISFPYSLNPLVNSLRLDQSWGMFAPTVFKEDGWLVIKADLSDGTSVDLNNDNKTPSFEKPEYVLSLFKNDRWRKYTEQIYVNNNNELRPYYAVFLINKWNADLSEKRKIKKITIFYMLEITEPPGKVENITPVILFERNIAAGDI